MLKNLLNKTFYIFLINFVLLFSLVFFQGIANYQGLIIDKTIAIVNNRVILFSELQEEVMIQAQMLGLSGLLSQEMEQIAQDILQNLIDTYLLEEKADEEGITVSDEKIQQTLDEQMQMFKDNFNSETDFKNFLTSQNTTEYELRKRYTELIERELKVSKLLQMELLPEVNIKESEITEFYENNKSELIDKLEISFNGIAIPITLPDNKLDELMIRLSNYRNRIINGEDFGELAKKYSETPDAQNGGLTDYFSTGEMIPEFEDVAFNLELGEISQPFTSSLGGHLIKLEAKEGNRIQVRHITLQFELSSEDKEIISKVANTTYNSMLIGEELENIQKEITEKYNIKTFIIKEDSISENTLTSKYPGLYENLFNTDEGEITPPIEGKNSYYIIKINSKSGGGIVSLSEARNYIKSVLRNEKVEELKEKWLTGLRERAFIKVFYD
jgi:parvulin-like peptidyl-prolyl isomerase